MMLGNLNSRGAKHGFFLLYVTCLVLSHAPSISAPPERAFSQGQPEMHQAMDNMVSHGILLKKTGPMFHPIHSMSYPAQLASKTTGLVDEAKHVLSKMNNPKERQWVQTYIQYMKGIIDKAPETTSPRNMTPASGTPVPADLPSQPTRSDPAAVPAPNPIQSSSRAKSSLPAPAPVRLDTATKPADKLNESEFEEDELERELHGLTKERPAAQGAQISPADASPVTPVRSTSLPVQKKRVDNETKMMEEQLKQLLTLLNSRGSNVLQIMLDFFNDLDRKTKSSARKHETKLASPENFKYEMLEIEQLDNNKNKEFMFKKSDLGTLNTGIRSLHNNKDQQLVKENDPNPKAPELTAFPKPNRHFPELSLSQPQLNQWGLGQDTGALLRTNTNNLHGNNPFNHRPNQMPENLRQNLMMPENRMQSNYGMMPHYNRFFSKVRYQSPYRNLQHGNQMNSTLHFPPGQLYNPNQMVNHPLANMLNDDMKRQLRDGKIVVLSDSVVQSNFNSSAGKNTDEDDRKKTTSST